MAIKYKGFQAYYCDPTTFANIEYIGRFEFSIVKLTADIATSTRYTVETASAAIDAATNERTQISGVIPNYSQPGAPDKARQICPIVLDYPFHNTGSEARIKLVAANGYYAVSFSTVVAGGTKVAGGAYDLYFDNDTLAGNISMYVDAADNSFSFIGFTGEIDPLPDTGMVGMYEIYTEYNFETNRVRISKTSVPLTSTVAKWFNDISPYIPPDEDPYAPGGTSDAGGGTGTFDGTSVDVDFTPLPTLSAVDTGFITLYNPSLSQLQSLASYMWSPLFDLDTLKKLFGDPMQAILGLSIVPGPVPNGGTQNVKIGNVDSGISMTKAASQYIDIDCGTLNVEEFWGAYLDYEPYTKAEIFLPFIGVHQIAIDDIMNKAVQIKYHIDLLSGGCACEIKCGGSVLYTFIGSCAVSIPVTGSDWTNLINGVLSAATAIGSMVATGGSSAPAAASTIASAAVNSLKPSIEKSGSISGAGGLLAGKVPVLILTRPRQALPGKQNTFTGYPAFITRSLNEISGYTEVHSIRLSGIDGTEGEIDEIEELLKGGVIL